jgi:hypothetical protein
VLLANAVAVLHAVAVLFMLTGGLAAVVLNRPQLLLAHVPVSLSILALNLTGADCPLTSVELWFRERAGDPGYSGGFLGHYVVEPMGLDIHASSTQVGIYVVALLPNLIAYGLLAASGPARPAPPPARRGPASRRSRRSPPGQTRSTPGPSPGVRERGAAQDPAHVHPRIDVPDRLL